MKVLFIGRGKKDDKLSPVLLAQANSLTERDINIHFFAVERGGITGYFHALLKLRKIKRLGQYDLFHAHYYVSGILAALSGVRPLVVSLMGSELKSGLPVKMAVRFFVRHIWKRTIVKSATMLKEVGFCQKIHVIPNGVNMQAFKLLDKSECQKRVGFDNSLKHILFLSDPLRKEKNYKLAADAVSLLPEDKFNLHALFDIDHNEIPVYMSASDLLLLTSCHEGSPNIVKEAMACNLPIVATAVGDIPELLANTKGCYITGFNPNDIADKIKRSLAFNKWTEGRTRIIELKLDSESVAVRIIELYNQVIENS